MTQITVTYDIILCGTNYKLGGAGLRIVKCSSAHRDYRVQDVAADGVEIGKLKNWQFHQHGECATLEEAELKLIAERVRLKDIDFEKINDYPSYFVNAGRGNPKCNPGNRPGTYHRH